MSRSQKRILQFLLQSPGVTVSEIAEGLHLTRQAVRDQIRLLCDEGVIQRVDGAAKKNVRFILAKEHLCDVEGNSTRELMGRNCQRRFERHFFENYCSNVSHDDNPRSGGAFDVLSTIHAAVVTDPQMRILNFSPRFEELVRQTTPHLIGKLQDRSLDYFGPPGKDSWFDSLSDLRRIDWEHGAVCSDASKEQHLSELWSDWVNGDGVIDGFSFRVDPTGRNPIYLELYLAPQRTFLGHQSMIMNVGERVAAVRMSSIKEQYYANMHHEFRQPLQTICALERQLSDALKLPDAQIKETLAAFAGKLTRTVSACLDTLALFPSRPNDTKVDVPVIGSLLTAIDEINRKFENKVKISDDRMHEERAKYLVTTIPVLHQIAVSGFLRNAVTHGCSDQPVVVSHHERRNGNLAIVISDHGKGMNPDEVAYWNDYSDGLRGADVSDLNKYDGLRIAIMGIKTAGGSVAFSQTSAQAPHGLTVTLYFPVKE